MKIRGLDSKDIWDYENSFYWFSPYNRIGKQIAHWELFKKIEGIPGEIIEVGVYKGASLIRWATFRELNENSWSKKIIGFDAFGSFPIDKNASNSDKNFVEDFSTAGGDGLRKEELEKILLNKNFQNIELVQGDAIETIPKFIEKNPQTRISLLHLDLDIYKPTIASLEYLWGLISKGGILIIDDYNDVRGATEAIDEFISKNKIKDYLKQTKYYYKPSFIIKT